MISLSKKCHECGTVPGTVPVRGFRFCEACIEKEPDWFASWYSSQAWANPLKEFFSLSGKGNSNGL